jgi:hypothetical protein
MRGHYVSTRQRCVVGNEARRSALTPNTGLWEDREREKVGLILSAMRLSRSLEEGLWHAS